MTFQIFVAILRGGAGGGGGGGGAKTVVLQKGKHGFGFILRGPKCKSKTVEWKCSRFPI